MSKTHHQQPNIGNDCLTERSCLLVMPSPNSTERASMENLRVLMEEGSTNVPLLSRDESFSAEMQLERFGKSSSRFDSDLVLGKSRRTKLLFVAAKVVALSFAFVALVALLVHGAKTWSSSHGGKQHVPSSVPVQSLYEPLSLLDPVQDLGLADFQHPKDSGPTTTMTHLLKETNNGTSKNKPFPTNSWYQNMLLVDGEPSDIHRSYVIPYVIDVVGPIPGLRIHPNRVGASEEVVQLYIQEPHGLTLGASADAAAHHSASDDPDPTTHRYNVQKMTNLGLTLQWISYPMSSSIVKGMPYATMVYDQIQNKHENGDLLLPTIASQIGLFQNPMADGTNILECAPKGSKPLLVERELELLFGDSDFTWLVFFSEPVMVQCVKSSMDGDDDGVKIQVLERNDSGQNGNGGSDDGPFVIRAALYKSCSTGLSPVYCHQEQMHPTALLLGQGDYRELLRAHANRYAGSDTKVSYAVDKDEGKIHMTFDWDVQEMSDPSLLSSNDTKGLLSYALPHHADIIDGGVSVFNEEIYCTSSLVGPACLVEGSTWNLTDTLPDIGFRAPRPPAPWSIRALGESLREDISYSLPDYYRRGAGDTYFSGKMLAKLGRILLVAEEIEELCSNDAGRSGKNSSDYSDECKGISLPSDKEMDKAVVLLRESVEVWLNGSAETPFVFDSSWGGVVSCGCLFEGNKCRNQFPDCPAFTDPGLNFGNGFYQDTHFHYGYHIFAAAVVSHFDPEWGRRFFERVLLLIRNIANPSDDDEFFPTFRHKDWYQGHSWAMGIVRPPYPNGKNQESSSEAIAAYEAVALYGNVMAKVWQETDPSSRQCQVANEVHAIGQVLTASELRAARKYYHLTHEPKQAVKIFPATYQANVIGIMWQMMAQFQTWFGKAPYLVYGIQLLPLTPISEMRDDVGWAKEMYHPFAESCDADDDCKQSGWSVLQLAVLATVGHQQIAMERAIQMPAKAFDGPDGDGHSLSNTIWYIATRPYVESPLSLANGTAVDKASASVNEVSPTDTLKHCYRPDSCTNYALDTIAGLYTCRQRIEWLMQIMGKSQEEACTQVAVVEHSKECGRCNPHGSKNATDQDNSHSLKCPPCTPAECGSDLNRCPRYQRTYVCTDGASIGGCTGNPWDAESGQCHSCCELTKCPKAIQAIPDAEKISVAQTVGNDVDDCPPCSAEVCRSSVNQCPIVGTAPFLCYMGSSAGGCSPKPWPVGGNPCLKCCKVLLGCDA